MINAYTKRKNVSENANAQKLSKSVDGREDANA